MAALETAGYGMMPSARNPKLWQQWKQLDVERRRLLETPS